jgi:dipeptidyl aminopeptidase/acylaminoacyl peptidase
VISLESVSAPAIAPDGRAIAYVVRSTDWKNNRFDNEIWLWREGSSAMPLTRTARGGSTTPRWSPDGRWLGFLSDRDGRQQLYLMPAGGGDPVQLTTLADGVTNYRWSPDGARIAIAAPEPESDSSRRRRALYGEFRIQDADYRMTHLWVLAAEPERWASGASELAPPTQLTKGSFTVGSFSWSPDGSRIAFEYLPDPTDRSQDFEGDIYVVTVASRQLQPLVTLPGNDQAPVWSPDGRWILFTSVGGDSLTSYYRNNELTKVPAGGGMLVRLAAGFDERFLSPSWNEQGIWFMAYQKTKRVLFRVDPATGSVAPSPGIPDVVSGADFSLDGRYMAVLGQPDEASLAEVTRVSLAHPEQVAPVTNMTAQLRGWTLGTHELVTWSSRDGVPIEGIVYRPADFDSRKKYPLLIVIHSGPVVTDWPQPFSSPSTYPVQNWLAKGAVILRLNYRGSSGYGGKFRALNVRNLGIGDMWDVLSGVDALIKRGFIDTTRMGAMGWSQGGYIAAFLTTNTTRFKAISVGAGISNWYSYYMTTALTPFTVQYLDGTPWQSPALYAKTSPMTTIDKARTPTLIQHGEFDPIVPIQNAYELYRGLLDHRVPVRLIIYNGFGHTITRPKERLAANWHNWQWFAKYLWGEEVTIPLEDEVPARQAGKQ